MGLAVFGVVYIKALLEALTGTPMLETLHFGQMGVPIVICHLGGVVGGTAAVFALRAQEVFISPSPSGRGGMCDEDKFLYRI